MKTAEILKIIEDEGPRAIEALESGGTLSLPGHAKLIDLAEYRRLLAEGGPPSNPLEGMSHNELGALCKSLGVEPIPSTKRDRVAAIMAARDAQTAKANEPESPPKTPAEVLADLNDEELMHEAEAAGVDVSDYLAGTQNRPELIEAILLSGA